MFKEEFLNRVAAFFGHIEVEKLSDDMVVGLLGVTQHAGDLLLNEAEKRHMIGVTRDGIFIPCGIPEDVDHIETVLTRGPPQTA